MAFIRGCYKGRLTSLLIKLLPGLLIKVTKKTMLLTLIVQKPASLGLQA